MDFWPLKNASKFGQIHSWHDSINLQVLLSRVPKCQQAVYYNEVRDVQQK